MPLAHSFITNDASTADVLASARHALENSGIPQWIHHHPHGHLCNHQCGPLDPPADQAPEPVQ